MQPFYDFIWKIQAFWLELSMPEKIVAAANLAWAGFWLLFIVSSELRCNGAACGWGFILGGIAWLAGQAVLAAVGLTVSLLFGSKSRD